MPQSCGLMQGRIRNISYMISLHGERRHKGLKYIKTICTDPVSESSIRKKPYTFGIWTPPADKISQQCHAAFLKDTGFAMLIPGDIVRYIPLDSSGHLGLLQTFYLKIFKTKISQISNPVSSSGFLPPKQRKTRVLVIM